MMKALEEARRDPESLKGRILAAARPVFAARGFHAATTRAIAGEVGIDVSTLYYHWGSKQALFDAILRDLELDFEDRLRVWVRATRDRRLDECFELAVEHFGGFFLDRDRVRVLLFTFFDEESAGKGWAVRSQRRLVQTLKIFVERRLGIVDPAPEFDVAVLSFVASLLTLVGSRHRLGEVLGVDPEGREYRDLVLRSLRSQVAVFTESLIRNRPGAIPALAKGVSEAD